MKHLGQFVSTHFIHQQRNCWVGSRIDIQNDHENVGRSGPNPNRYASSVDLKTCDFRKILPLNHIRSDFRKASLASFSTHKIWSNVSHVGDKRCRFLRYFKHDVTQFHATKNTPDRDMKWYQFELGLKWFPIKINYNKYWSLELSRYCNLCLHIPFIFGP